MTLMRGWVQRYQTPQCALIQESFVEISGAWNCRCVQPELRGAGRERTRRRMRCCVYDVRHTLDGFSSLSGCISYHFRFIADCTIRNRHDARHRCLLPTSLDDLTQYLKTFAIGIR